MTYVILIVTVVVSIACFNNYSLFNKLSCNPYRMVHSGEWYRIISHGFVHADWTHLIVNMFTTDDELVKAAVFGLHIVFAVFPIVGFQMVATNFFLSIGMSKKAIFLSLTRQLLFLIPCLIILPRFFGTLGVWISMPVADTIATVVTAIVLVNQFKKFKQ